MLFWLVAALLTIAASAAVLWPLTRRGRVSADAGNDLRVYRDQLSEIDSDLERGSIAAGEAEQARAEIGRRIMRQASTAAAASAGSGSSAFRAVSLVAVLSVPLVSWGLYGLIGSPDLPSQPLQARLAKPAGESTAEELIARAENHLAQNPDDGRGWDVLAPTYLRLGRYDQAATAYRNALRLEGDSAERLAGLAEALTMANDGIVSADAEAAFNKALSLDPKAGKARFFLAMGLMQDGKKADAEAAWQAMADDASLDERWHQAARYALEQLARQEAANPGPPSQEAVDQAAEMSPQDRAAMIEQMVAGLDQKLRANPDDPEGWIKLVRSYLVLGKPDEAKAAAKRAIDALGGDSDGGRKVAAFAADQGVSLKE
jgi:cytochrome c-type biogenesis protein CcmH